MLVLQTLGVAVGLVARRPVAVKGVRPEGLPVLQRRHVAHVLLGDGEVRETGDGADFRGPPAAAHGIFEEGVDGIERAAGAVAGEEQILPHRLDDDAVGLQALQVQVRSDSDSPRVPVRPAAADPRASRRWS